MYIAQVLTRAPLGSGDQRAPLGGGGHFGPPPRYLENHAT